MELRFDPERPQLTVQSKKDLGQGAPPTTSSTLHPLPPASLSPGGKARTVDARSSLVWGGQREEDFHPVLQHPLLTKEMDVPSVAYFLTNQYLLNINYSWYPSIYRSQCPATYMA